MLNIKGKYKSVVSNYIVPSDIKDRISLDVDYMFGYCLLPVEEVYRRGWMKRSTLKELGLVDWLDIKMQIRAKILLWKISVIVRRFFNNFKER